MIVATYSRSQTCQRSLRGSAPAEACHQQQASPLGNPQVTKQEPSAKLWEPEQLRTRSSQPCRAQTTCTSGRSKATFPQNSVETGFQSQHLYQSISGLVAEYIVAIDVTRVRLIRAIKSSNKALGAHPPRRRVIIIGRPPLETPR